MILFLEAGALGNQLFQYVGLKKYFPKEKLIFLGHQNIHLLFKNIDGNFVNMKKYMFFFYLLKYLIIFFIRIRLLGVVYEDATNKNFKISIKKGLFWWIKICHNIYFQHSDLIEQIDNPPILKSKMIKKGFEWFEKKKIDLKKNKIVFVHIRRTDYLYWPSKEFPGVININWYKRVMGLIKKKIQNPIFVLMGDDQQYIRNFFKENNSIIISDNKAEIDLSIMSLCNAGILSASSFAWWGAFFAKTRNENSSYFIAPNYWLGHRKKKWFPDNFYTKWITYFD
jgi:hypothetical protein